MNDNDDFIGQYSREIFPVIHTDENEVVVVGSGDVQSRMMSPVIIHVRC